MGRVCERTLRNILVAPSLRQDAARSKHQWTGEKRNALPWNAASNLWIKLATAPFWSRPPPLSPPPPPSPSSSYLFTAVTLILSPCHWEQGFIVLWLWKHGDTQLVNGAWLCWAVNYKRLAVWLIKITLLNVFIVRNPGRTRTKPLISYPTLSYGNNICRPGVDAESRLVQRFVRSFLVKTSKMWAVKTGSLTNALLSKERRRGGGQQSSKHAERSVVLRHAFSQKSTKLRRH